MCASRLFLVLFALVISAPCQKILLLQTEKKGSAEMDRIKKIATLFGLDVWSTNPESLSETMQSIRDKGIVIQAVLASADALSTLGDGAQERLFSISRRSHLPVLVFDVNSTTSSSLLSRWSHHKVSSCVHDPSSPEPDPTISISKAQSYGPLAGREIPSVMKADCLFVEGGNDGVEQVITTSKSSQKNAALIRVDGVFFAPQLKFVDPPPGSTPQSISEVFSSVAPFAIFLRDVAGDYAWHLDGHYANFTIDDPWLVQPYGNLDYESLLAAMKEHNFHTTIAFIPWNYDRSKPGVSQLFRENSKYYSICIHGNNHTHREFGDYLENPLARQTEDIQQAVARMDEFHRLTGIRYDRFMVFPHGVAPEATFGQLKRYGFLGTANSLNVPLDDLSREDPLDGLRSFTNQYQSFLSISRYSAEVPISNADLAVQAYLGNPILIYAHQEDFRAGNRFIVDVVDRINQLVPDVQWMSLGDLARRLYLLRKRADSTGYDVAILSKEATITNHTSETAMFYVHLTMPWSEIAAIQIDNQLAPSSKEENGLPLRVEIQAGQSRTVSIRLVGETRLSRAVVRKGSVRSYALRSISDFRDLYLARTGMGRTFIDWYYLNGADSIELFVEQRWKYIVGFIAALCLFIFGVRKAQIVGQS